MKDTVPVDWVQLDTDTAPILEKVLQSVYNGTASENGRPERVSERLVSGDGFAGASAREFAKVQSHL